MKGFNNKLLLNLITSREAYKLTKSRALMNPITQLPLTEASKQAQPLKNPVTDSVDRMYHRIQMELEPFYARTRFTGSSQSRRSTASSSEKPFEPLDPDQLRAASLRKAVTSLKDQGLNLQFIESLRQEVSMLTPSSYEKCSTELEYLSKSISSVLQMNERLEKVLRFEAFDLLHGMETKLYKHYSSKDNKVKLKQCAYRLMIANKRITEEKGLENLPIQLFWMLEYGLHCRHTKNYSEAYMLYEEVFRKSENNQDCTLLRNQALTHISSILEEQKKVEELTVFLNHAKQNANQTHYDLIFGALSRIADGDTLAMIVEGKNGIAEKQETLQVSENPRK